MPEGFITVKEAACLLDMTRQRIGQLIRGKQIQAQRVGRSKMYIILASEMRRFLELRAQKGRNV